MKPRRVVDDLVSLTDIAPTKRYMVENRLRDTRHADLYRLAFGKRPAEELYDLSNDPEQLDNVAADPTYAGERARLSERLTEALRATGDPRVVGDGDRFDRFPYYGGSPLKPNFNREKAVRSP